ncbi:signal peptidase I [Corynebacterium sp. MNWGS58]|uniref:signal peptidase I n=1 Tax=Corynebacterium sp. 102791.4 TaxID=3104612 RepID=UPI0035147932
MTRTSNSSSGLWRWWVIGATAVVTFALLAGIQAFVGRVYVVPSSSMEPTLQGCTDCATKNDRILVDKLAYRFGSPQPGDVAVFDGTESWQAGFSSPRSDNRFVRGLQNLGSAIGLIAPDANSFVKRVIATEGQTVQCLPGDAGVLVDAKLLAEPYVASAPAHHAVTAQGGAAACGGQFFGPVTVPDGQVWVMGDNRTNSLDSREYVGDPYQGTVPEDHFIGKVRGIVLPLNRFGGVE